MSTPSQNPATLPDNFHYVGGQMVLPTQPVVIPYPLRRDEFLTFRDGEMSTARSIRDSSIGAAVTGLVGVVGIYLTIDWSAAAEQGRHPFRLMVLLCTLTLSAAIIAIAEHIRVQQTHADSSYSRLTKTISDYFDGLAQ